MIKPSELRIGNLIYHQSNWGRVEAIGKKDITIKYLAGENKGFEMLHNYDDPYIGRVYFSLSLVTQMMHFVAYGEQPINARMPEFTDGRMILRFLPDDVKLSVFTTIDMPWATPDFPLQMYYITQVSYLDQLQNLYFDLFKEELLIELQ